MSPGGDGIPFPGKDPAQGASAVLQQHHNREQEQVDSPKGSLNTTHTRFSNDQLLGDNSSEILGGEHLYQPPQIFTSRQQRRSPHDSKPQVDYQSCEKIGGVVFDRLACEMDGSRVYQQDFRNHGYEYAVQTPIVYDEHHAPPPPSQPPPASAAAINKWIESMLTTIPHFKGYSPMWGYNPSTGEPWLSLRTQHATSYSKLIGKCGRHDVVAAFLNKIYMRTNTKFRIEYLWLNRQNLVLLWVEFTHLHACDDMRAWEVLGELRAFLQEWINIPDPSQVDFAYDEFMNRPSSNRASLALPAGFPSGPGTTTAVWRNSGTIAALQTDNQPWVNQLQVQQVQQGLCVAPNQINFPNQYVPGPVPTYAPAPGSGVFAPIHGGPVLQTPYFGQHKTSKRPPRSFLAAKHDSGTRIGKQTHSNVRVVQGNQTDPQGSTCNFVSILVSYR